MQSNEINELASALVSAQAEFSAVPKGSVNPFFKSKYAALPDVVQSASPVLTKHGLAVSQHIATGMNGADILVTYLIHKSGQYIAHDMTLHLPKSDPQGQGSAVTYARRYSYMSVLGLVADEDDDGNKASQAPKSAPKSKQPTPLDNMRELLAKKFDEPADRKAFCEERVQRTLKSLNDLEEAEIVGIILELS
jgi:hypothetical protein